VKRYTKESREGKQEMPKPSVDVSLGVGDFAKIREIRDRLKEVDDPADDFDGRHELLKIVSKNASVLELGTKYDGAKEIAKKAKEVWEVASQELQEMIAELGREYPLFERNHP